jgi:hypothetical protein
MQWTAVSNHTLWTVDRFRALDRVQGKMAPPFGFCPVIEFYDDEQTTTIKTVATAANTTTTTAFVFPFHNVTQVVCLFLDQTNAGLRSN